MKFYKDLVENLRKAPILNKKQEKLFNFSNDAFIKVKKLKFSKELLSIFLITAISVTFLLAPVFADETISTTTDEEILDEIVIITTENGAILNEVETDLVKEGLKLLENKAIVPEEFTVIREKASPPHLNYLATDDYEFIDWGVRSITSYNSEVGQCDADPCTTANMFNVCDHGIEDTIAANFLKFGTKVRIPESFGNRIFIVRDRMNKRYPDRVDVWMINKQDSRNFGLRRARIEVVLEKDNSLINETN